jgi:Lar family restriction alleviation protein
VKACPFCGTLHVDFVHFAEGYGWYGRAVCSNCGAAGPAVVATSAKHDAPWRTEALRRWNERDAQELKQVS